MPTVLVVEHDEALREIIHDLLTDEGYLVLSADGGMRTLEMMRQWPGHAVVLFDYQMPRGDGLDMLNAVADDETLQHRYAYICMAATDSSRLPAEFTALMEVLEVPLVSKPFSIDELLCIISEAHQRLLRLAPHRWTDLSQT
jgi:CheY-like chemotaxis protein